MQCPHFVFSNFSGFTYLARLMKKSFDTGNYISIYGLCLSLFELHNEQLMTFLISHLNVYEKLFMILSLYASYILIYNMLSIFFKISLGLCCCFISFSRIYKASHKELIGRYLFFANCIRKKIYCNAASAATVPIGFVETEVLHKILCHPSG